MHLLRDARKLVEYVLTLPSFNIEVEHFNSYNHMGAIITDTILQAGLNYRTVVEPRVIDILKRYPEARTTTEFLDILETNGANKVLKWHHQEKLNRVQQLTYFLIYKEIETEHKLRHWLIYPENCKTLLNIHGIGPKSIDYLAEMGFVELCMGVESGSDRILNVINN